MQIKMFKFNMLLPTFKKCFIFFQEFGKPLQTFSTKPPQMW